MDDALLRFAGREIREAKRISVVSHIRPDGDAVGSVLGLGLALREAGKQVQMILADGVPSTFRHLPGADRVRPHQEGDVDLVIVLDCSDFSRVGSGLDSKILPDINVDHHLTNLNFAQINLVDTQAVATAELLAEFMPRWGLPLSQPVAEALLTGLITDTLGFRTNNMTSQALRIAADLVDIGADLPELYARALIERSFEAARFWGVGLSKLTRDGPIVWTSITIEDRRSAGYPGKDDADLINVLASIQGCAVSVIFVEQPGGRVKVSWRAQPDIDITPVAVQFGGGGHPSAAGAELKGEMEEVQEAVLKATRMLLSSPAIQKMRDASAERI